MTDAETWKRRERSLAYGTVIWALAVSTAATLFPQETATFVFETDSLNLAAVMLISIGLCAGIVDTARIAVSWWEEPDDSGLTEVRWDE